MQSVAKVIRWMHYADIGRGTDANITIRLHPDHGTSRRAIKASERVCCKVEDIIYNTYTDTDQPGLGTSRSQNQASKQTDRWTHHSLLKELEQLLGCFIKNCLVEILEGY
jgi:hypothetical protein